MTSVRRWLFVLRSVAVLIAVLGVLDPQIVSPRVGKPTVAVVAVDDIADRERSARVASALEDNFTVIPSRFALADATVLVGQRFAANDDALTQPTVVVMPNAAETPLSITRVSVPAEMTALAPALVSVDVDVIDTTTSAIDVVLLANGVTADSVRFSLGQGGPGQAASTLTVSFVPSSLGDVRLEITARAVGAGAAVALNAPEPARAAVVTSVRDTRRNVLVYDTRPSFMSTFVRRALERDPRLNVASRIITSRDISTATGAPPAELTARDALQAYDLIMVGAPDALTAASVQALERYLRETGGSVLLLLDAPVGGAINNLVRIASWRARTVDQGAVLRGATWAPLTLRAAEQYWPLIMPAEARVLAFGAASRADSLALGADAAPLIWQTPVGLGALYVSGALDAWRFRDAEQSDFAAAWPQLAFEAASRAVPPVSVTVAQSVLAPGERTLVEVLWRDALTGVAAMDSASVTAVLELAGSDSMHEVPVPLFPSADPGVLRGVLRAPGWSGMAQLVVRANDYRTAVPVVVDSARPRSAAGGVAALADWAVARGGWAISDAQVPQLSASLKRALAIEARDVTWHPMRSVWWLVPFVLALCGEWWVRRRSGLA